MPPKTINLGEKFAAFEDHWAPKVIAEMNDYQFKLARIQGEFVWHKHDDTDEVFICIKGRMTIEFRDGVAKLKEGEMLVVPKGTEHRPTAEEECHIMLVEPRGVVNTGDADTNHRTAKEDVWI
ncbi:MAG: cupin domain-containing protein [Gammaproteobacteria bacterium]|nr:cupin domain-containing protein [Gammaproteobacteria bacterium]